MISIQFCHAQTGTQVGGIIGSDTTWTKANSPYTFTGPVAINAGVTVTIQAGAKVNLGSYYLRVNGTLTAQGDSNNPIQISGTPGSLITFYPSSTSSTSWNWETSTGSIIGNTILDSVSILIYASSPRINNNTFIGSVDRTQTPEKILVTGGSPTITNNIITGGEGVIGIGSDNYDDGYLSTHIGSVANNAFISSNIISCRRCGFFLTSGTPTIENNIITNSTQAFGSSGTNGAIIILEGTRGSTSPLIINNTITNSADAIVMIDSPTPVITNNNIFDNQYNVYLASNRHDVDVTNNWWGTTNTQTIDQTILDFKDDFNLGAVNYQPYLTQPNPQALPNGATTPSTKNVQTTASTSVEPKSVSLGSRVTIYASIAPSPPTPFDQFTNIMVTIVHPDGTNEIKGPFPYTTTYYQQYAQLLQYTPTTSGNYSFTLNFASHYFVVANTKYLATNSAPAFLTVQTTEPTPSPTPPATSTTPTPTPTPAPAPLPTQISISVSATSTAVGSTINVHGGLSDSNGNPLPNEQVIFSYAVAGSGSWFQIGSGTTNSAGDYDIQWVPTASGTFTLKAEWSGDANHQPANSHTTLSLLPYQNQQVFLVESNSTVTGLNFNSVSFTLSFEVSGSEGTTGYVKAEIAKTLAPNFTGITVSLDGKELNFTVSSSNDYWIIAFTYHHSTHQVTVNLSKDAEVNPTPTTPDPEFPIWAIFPLFMVAAMLIFVFTRKSCQKIILESFFCFLG